MNEINQIFCVEENGDLLAYWAVSEEEKMEKGQTEAGEASPTAFFSPTRTAGRR